MPQCLAVTPESLWAAEYMVPDTVVPMDEIPRLPNGKVNRRGLPEPDFQLQRRENHEAASNDVETRVQQIWQEVRQPHVHCFVAGDARYTCCFADQVQMSAVTGGN